MLAPPPRITAPAAGKMTRGWASSIAAMSETNVIRTFGAPRRKRKPSMTEPSPARVASPSACGSGGSACSRHSPQSAAIVTSASTVYAAANPAQSTSRPASSGPSHHRHRHRHDPERVGGGQLLARQDPRVDARAGRRADAERAVPHGDEDVEHPDVLVPEPRLHRARDRRQPGDEVGDERDRAPVVVVRQRPAVQPHDDERHEREQPDEADRRRRPGDLVHLEPDRDDGHLRADVGQREPGVEPPVCHVLPERGEVREVGAQHPPIMHDSPACGAPARA